MYDDAKETKPILIGESGIITFSRHFKYLGSYISYALKYYYEIEHRISQASVAMGALNNFWVDNTVDHFSKYHFLRNYLQSTYVGMRELVDSRSNVKEIGGIYSQKCKKILKITITMVIDEKITNESVRKQFFNIPTIRYQLTKRQLTFIGKVFSNSEYQIPTQLLTAWCDNKRKPGAPLQNNNKNLAQNIRLIVPGAAKDGLLTTWVYLALDGGYWAHQIKQLGTHPSTWNGAEPNPRSMPHPRSSQRTAAPTTPPCIQALPNSPPHFRARDPHFTPTPPRRNAPQTSPGREASPRRENSPRRTQSDNHNYDPRKVGHTRKDSLGILNIPVSTSAKEIEIKVQYRRLARIYHPDKYDPTKNKISKYEAQEHFKLINNAYEFLCT